jgi:hypothetical protein
LKFGRLDGRSCGADVPGRLGAKRGAAVKLDEAILEELEIGGEGTAKEIRERLSAHVQHALERLVCDKKVIKTGYKGQGNIKYYDLPSPPPAHIERRI